MNLQHYYEPIDTTPMIQTKTESKVRYLILFLTNFMLNLSYIYFLISSYIYIKKNVNSPMLAIEFIICEVVYLIIHIILIGYLTKHYTKYTYDSLIFVCDTIVKFPLQTFINARIIKNLMDSNSHLNIMIAVITLNYIQDIVNLFVFLKK